MNKLKSVLINTKNIFDIFNQNSIMKIISLFNPTKFEPVWHECLKFDILQRPVFNLEKNKNKVQIDLVSLKYFKFIWIEIILMNLSSTWYKGRTDMKDKKNFFFL